ncbi:MAG: discoidin domain-containing protein, partial [Ruminococcus sp.]|nr:discoidin domain-containing protein [Ruminococcus sp.]
DWNTLAQYIADGGKTSGKFFKMTDNISVSTAVGSGGYHFSGTFDGDGHTLTLDNMSGAPFSIEGATIKNLKVDGSVSGGRHVSALVGGIGGTADNLIENCHVAATVTTSDAYCGGFVGHGGSKAKTTIKNCVFSGTINGATAGTFWGWSDSGSTPVLINCIDISESTQPIGRGEPKDASVTNCYYTKDGKETGGGRPWSNQGKRAYTVTGDGVTLNGAPGIRYNGTIYAGEGDQVSLTVSNIEDLYNASAGTLERNGSHLILTMPAKDVTVAKPENAEPITGYSNAVGTGGNNNEGAENFVDGKTDTKWCYSSSSYPLSITFRSNDDVTPFGYILTTANDTAKYPERNPKGWTLEGSADGQNWTTLSDVSDNTTLQAKNYTSYTFPLNNPDHTAFSYYRFTVKGTVGGGTFQLSEFQLIGNSEPPVEYYLWLGSTRVTSRNKDDILNDGGKAMFDPDTNTLTLNEPTISGLHDSTKIDCALNQITVKGSYHMAEDDFSASYGFYCDNNVTLDGDFTFVAKVRAIAGCAPLTIRSGSVKFISRLLEAVYARGALYIKNNVTRFEAVSRDEKAIYTAWFSRGNLINVTTPENGVIKEHKVYEADGETLAKHVVLDRAPEVGYNIWLGDTQVTNYNQDDILNDGGKAKFDPETNTLTLDNPTITGSHGYATIYADHVIVFKGTYHMTEAVAKYGVYTELYTEFRGDFTFMGTDSGVYAEQYSKILSGSLKAVGGNSGYYGWWETTIGRDITRFEADGGNDAYDGNYLQLDEGLMIVEPEGGYLSYGNYGKWIRTAGGSFAKHAVIVPKPIILGDVDGDGEVEIRDATWIQRHAVQLDIPFEITKKPADVDGDGEITVMDATAIQYYLAHMKSIYHIGEAV